MQLHFLKVWTQNLLFICIKILWWWKLNSIYIFGDSYGDIKHNLHIKYKRWYDFSDEYTVKNFCLSGTGPLYALGNYYDNLSNIADTDVLIFILSSSHRIPFRFLYDQSHSSFLGALINPSVKESDLDSTSYQICDFLSKYQTEISSYYDVKIKDDIFEIYKNILFLKSISKLKSQKIFVFRSFNISTYFSDGYDITDSFSKKIPLHEFNIKDSVSIKNLLDELVLSLNANDDNFYLHDKSLVQVTLNEYDKGYTESTMANHLSEKNHEILFNFLSEKIRGNNVSLEFAESKQYFSETNFIYE